MTSRNSKRRRAADEDHQPGLVVLVGGSSTGKSRAAYEAVTKYLPGWPLHAPPTARDLAESISRNEVHAPCVLWLDGARSYLEDPDIARWLSDNLLRRPAAGLIVIATMWRSSWSALDPPDDRDPDMRFWAASLLRLAVRLDVPDKFDHADMEWAEAQSRTDPLMAAAVRDARSTGRITQALAAGPGLDHYYRDASPQTRAVLTAAMEGRRLGYGGLMTAEYLRTAAAGYLAEEVRPRLGVGWFNRALRDCTVQVKGAVAPLTPVRTQPDAGPPEGYRLADYLDQLGRDILRGEPTPGAAWPVIADHVHGPAERAAVAQQADRRGLLEQAYILAKPAADAGDVRAMGAVAAQNERWRLGEAARHWWQKAAALGDSAAMCHLALYEEQQKHQEKANSWWQRSANVGNPYAIWQLADRLDRSGRGAEADEILTKAAEAGAGAAAQRAGVRGAGLRGKGEAVFVSWRRRR